MFSGGIEREKSHEVRLRTLQSNRSQMIYPIVRIPFSFLQLVQFSLLCKEFCILSKKPNVKAFIIILGVTMKAVAFES